MADFISTQDMINVKQDIEDIGLSVNTDGIITPRYGAAYDSLPKVIREMIEQKNLKLAELQTAIDTAVAAGVGAAGWYSYLVVHDNGETQKQINDYIGATWYARVGGYDIGDWARLSSGQVVISTIDSNSNNPNSNMTGWSVLSLSDLIVPDLPIGKKLRVLAGAIRNSGSGWVWINDGAHEPYGVTPTITTSGVGITINYGFTASQVVTLVATTDETFAHLGLTVGSSVGLSSASIEPKAPLRFTVDTEAQKVTVPAYFSSVVSASTVSGVCTVTHPSILGAGDAPLFTPVGTTIQNHTDVTASYSTTETRLVGVGFCDGAISYNGSSWVYAGELSVSPTMNWVTVGGTDAYLEVNHGRSDTFNISVVPRGTIRPVVSSVNGNGLQFTVRFYDSAGNLVLTPSSQMNFFFSRKARLQKKALRGQFSVSRGYAAIIPADLVNATGNIWIYGLMEV